MSLLDRIHDLRPCDPADYIRFMVGGVQVGMMKPVFRECLAGFPGVFDVAEDAVYLASQLTDFESRTEAVAEVLENLRDQALVPGWRGELYPVNRAFGEPSMFDMERAASTLFGIRTYGVNLVGYVLSPGGAPSMWVARRSESKETNPGKLDIIVGGGQPVGISLFENLIKECREEAAIPEALARQAKPAGATCFCTERVEGIRDDVHYNYDLELPDGFTPSNTDGEVQEFSLWTMDQIMETLSAGDAFAFDSALVLLDFLVRHGNIERDDPVNLALAQHRASAFDG